MCHAATRCVQQELCPIFCGVLPCGTAHVVQCFSPPEQTFAAQVSQAEIRSARFADGSLLRRFADGNSQRRFRRKGFGGAGFAGRGSQERLRRQEVLSATLLVYKRYAVYTWQWVRLIISLLTWQAKLTSVSLLASLFCHHLSPNRSFLSSVSPLRCHNLSPVLEITEQL